MTREEIMNMPAGAEMDALIANIVLKLTIDPTRCPYCGESLWIGKERNRCTSCSEWRYSPYKQYSDEIAAAWEVVEYFTNNGWCPGLLFDDNGHWALSFEGAQSISFGDEPVDISTAFFVTKDLWCNTAPLAICRAALLAVMDVPS